MISKTIKAKNMFSGEEEEKVHYFNLTESEALEINLMDDLEAVGKSEDPKAIIPVFKHIITYAYGVRVGGDFIKDDRAAKAFIASKAYSVLFLELLQAGEKSVSDFIKSMLDFNVEDLKNRQAGQTSPTRPEPQDYKPSAREIAARAAAEKETVMTAERHPDPAEAKRVPNYPSDDTSIRFEDSPEYKQYLARQAAEQANETVNLGNQPIELKPEPAITDVSDADRTANPPFTNGN